MGVRIPSRVPIMLIDKGTCYYDTEAKFVPHYDRDGNYTGGHYCPYIPKAIINKENKMRYKVRPGDTLSSLSKTFGTTVEDIMAANPKIANKNLIYAGDVINIPANIGKGVKDIFSGWWDWYKNFFKF